MQEKFSSEERSFVQFYLVNRNPGFARIMLNNDCKSLFVAIADLRDTFLPADAAVPVARRVQSFFQGLAGQRRAFQA